MRSTDQDKTPEQAGIKTTPTAMSIRFYLLVIASLMLITTINHRDSNANPDYKCYVYEQGCK